MIFNSYQFLFVFLPLVMTGTFVLARRGADTAQLWLIVASICFYAAWNPVYLPLLLGSIGFNYLIARWMTRSESQKLRTGLLCTAVAVDLALLGYYKYAGFFIATLNQAAGTHYAWQSLILPLGISFYTFQQLTLLADISSGEVERFRFRDFVLFVTFFPHLIAGPDRASSGDDAAVPASRLPVEPGKHGGRRDSVLRGPVQESDPGRRHRRSRHAGLRLRRRRARRFRCCSPGPPPSGSRCRCISISAAIRTWRWGSRGWWGSGCR